jgi:hypothetical protein
MLSNAISKRFAMSIKVSHELKFKEVSLMNKCSLAGPVLVDDCAIADAETDQYAKKCPVANMYIRMGYESAGINI